MIYERNPDYRWWRPKAAWKYTLLEDYAIQTPIMDADGGDHWAYITPDGVLRLAAGFKWDGASGPAIDTETFMRASLVHDALYQLIRRGVIYDRAAADAMLHDIAREDGMWAVRALYSYLAVRLFGGIVLAYPEDAL